MKEKFRTLLHVDTASGAHNAPNPDLNVLPDGLPLVSTHVSVHPELAPAREQPMAPSPYFCPDTCAPEHWHLRPIDPETRVISARGPAIRGRTYYPAPDSTAARCAPLTPIILQAPPRRIVVSLWIWAALEFRP